jgi:hypothetical protein
MSYESMDEAAGLFLPELLKLKVGGIELEKSPVEHQKPTSFNLSRSPT